MRIRHRVQVRIARDTEMRRAQFNDDVQLSENVIDNYQRQANGDLDIAESGVESLVFGDVDAVKGIHIEVDRDCEIRLNGSADPIIMRIPPGATSAVAKMFLEADITAAEITNLDSVNRLTGVFVVWGDAIP